MTAPFIQLMSNGNRVERNLTSAQKHLLTEFQNGAKVRQGNLVMTRSDGSTVRFDTRSLLPLIDARLIWVNPTDVTYWVTK